MIKGNEHILIIKLSSIGDVVHTIPFVEVLKSNYPELKIDWCVDKESFSIINENPYIRRIIISNRNEWKRALLYPDRWPTIAKEIYFFAKRLNSTKYDIIIDLQGLLKSGIIAGICRAKRKIGLNGAREYGWIFVNESVAVNYDQHAIERYLQVAKYLGCTSMNWSWKIYISDKDRQKTDELISCVTKDSTPFVCINACSRWKTKQWSKKNFSELAKRLIDMGIKPIFIGSEKDKRRIDEIIDKAEGSANLSGMLDLKQLAYLYSRSRAVISVDTGPMHIAAMAKAKVVAIFGPTDPKRTGPYGKGHKIIRADIPCSPCFKKECSYMDCMNNIGVDKVMDSVIKILKEETG